MIYELTVLIFNIFLITLMLLSVGFFFTLFVGYFIVYFLPLVSSFGEAYYSTVEEIDKYNV